MTRPCATCKWFADEGRVETFRVGQVTHVAPSMWLVGRTRFVDTPTALRQWAEQCELRQRFEAQQRKRVA